MEAISTRLELSGERLPGTIKWQMSAYWEKQLRQAFPAITKTSSKHMENPLPLIQIGLKARRQKWLANRIVQISRKSFIFQSVTIYIVVIWITMPYCQPRRAPEGENPPYPFFYYHHAGNVNNLIPPEQIATSKKWVGEWRCVKGGLQAIWIGHPIWDCLWCSGCRTRWNSQNSYRKHHLLRMFKYFLTYGWCFILLSSCLIESTQQFMG